MTRKPNRAVPMPRELRPSTALARTEALRLAVELDTLGADVSNTQPGSVPGEWLVVEWVDGAPLRTTICAWSDSDA